MRLSECPVRATIDVIEGKWKPIIVNALKRGTLRFGQLRREVPEATKKVLTEQLRELARTLNIGQLMLLMQFGNMSTDVTRYNTRLFAEKVMPKLKPLFGEWENRWWPRPIDQRQRAQPRTVGVAFAAASAR